LQPLGDARTFSYPQAKFIHIAGMVRHLAILILRRSPPPGTDDHWLESYVAGHAHKQRREHRRFSYLPLPSIGHPQVNPSIRRVLITAPPGDDAWLQHLARRLTGQVLQPTPQTKLPAPPALVRIPPDSVALRYLQPAAEWHSVTPVLLPGHDDHKPAKTRNLIEKALQQSGVELPCEFEWSAFSRFPKSFSAHKYIREGEPAGYLRPNHLISNTAVHLTIRFPDGVMVPGPLVIGAGRHCGFGLMASCD
jgi:CRISPR-associated protein Csb2